MHVNLSPELQAKLAHIAAENSSTSEEYVRQLVERYIDHDARFRKKVRIGLGQLERGEFVTHEDIDSHIDHIFQS